MQIKGIDVSRWQGTIDWAKVAKSGIGFAIIKAGGSDAGFYKDPKFETNYKKAKANGVPIGAYYYVGNKFNGKESGEADAERFYQIIKDKQFEYPIALDMEENTGNKQQATEATKAFCDYLEAKGYYVVIYGSEYSTFQSKIDYKQLTAYDKWVAKWTTKEPKTVKPFGIWQYSSNGTVNGISGRVDMDYAYKEYPKIMKANGLNGFAKETTVEYKEYVLTGNEKLVTDDTTYEVKAGSTVYVK